MSVWKRLQRVGKKAAKFQLTACYHSLSVDCGRAYQPHRLVVVWTRRNRRYSTDPAVWTASLANPRQCCVAWEPPENVEITSILYRDPKREEYESKEWTFVLEDHMANGRRKAIASRPVDLQKLCLSSGEPKQTPLTVKLKPGSKKVSSATLTLTLHSVLLDREKDAQDEDMVSIASLMSLNDSRRDSGGFGGRARAPAATGGEIANLGDFDDEVDVPMPDDHDASFSRLVEKLRDLDADVESSRHADDESAAATPTNDRVVPTVQAATLAESPAAKPVEQESGSAASQDLLAWAQSVTAGYRGVFVNNLTTSFRNGLAFCAIIHRHRPDLLEFSNLKAFDMRENNRRAFEAAHQLGVPRVLDPADMVMKNIPDQLLVMTFLHQLRAHFTNQEIRVARLGASESSYTLAQPDSAKDRSQSADSSKPAVTADSSHPSSTPGPDAKSSLSMPKSKTDSSISAANAKFAALSEKVAATVQPSTSGDGFKELRQARDRDLAKRAGRLLSGFNNDGSVREQVPAGAAVRPSVASFQLKSELKARSPASASRPTGDAGARVASGNNTDENRTAPADGEEDEDDDEDDARSSVLSNFNRVLDTSAYVASERLALEAEQTEIDGQAVVLEIRLRGILCATGGPASASSKDEEQTLLTQWFQLVNKKNALIQRARQLDMLDQEQDLEKRYRMLELELRGAMSVEDWQKTDEERRREDLLLRDLMDIVRKRDDVVRQMDLHEREIVKDLDIERKTMERLNRAASGGGGRTCSLQ